MVNSGSFESDGDRNTADGFIQANNTSESSQSPSHPAVSSVPLCKNDFSQTADSDLPSVADAIEPTPTKTEFNISMPVNNCTDLPSADATLDKPSGQKTETSPSSSVDELLDKATLYCSVPLEKVQGVLTTCGGSSAAVGKPVEDSEVKVKTNSRKLLCLYCDRSFGSANLRQKHVQRFHSTKKNRRISSRRQQNQLTSTPCIYCDKLSTEHTLKELFEHLITEHSSRYFACLSCEIRFLNSSSLSEHNASIHATTQPHTALRPMSTTPLEKDSSPAPIFKQEEPPDTQSPLPEIKNESDISKSSTNIKKEEDEILPQDSETPVSRVSNPASQENSSGGKQTTPVKLTRSKLRIMGDTKNDQVKIKDAEKKRENLRQLRSRKMTVKSCKISQKRISKRLQAKITESQKKRRTKPANTEQVSNQKTAEKTQKTNSGCINPYPEFDSNYRVKKITDHSIDNLKISSLKFDDVFDKAFFSRIQCNIQENLLHHIDGKLFKNEESENRISNFEKISTVTQEVQNSNAENYGCELSLNAVTPVASLLSSAHFGEDMESLIEYGSKPSKKKINNIRRDEVHYKYFTRRKYQASIMEHKENRDLSKLDMWTQLVIKSRQQKMADNNKSAKEMLEYTSGSEYKNRIRREELNRILDRRGPFEDLKEEATKKAALDKLNSSCQEKISEESFTEVREILGDILERVFEEVNESAEDTAPDAVFIPDSPKREKPTEEVARIPSYLNLRRSSSLPSDGEIDKSDKIALICSSQEAEYFELPSNSVRAKNEMIELTGEWARCRIYICAACGEKVPNMKQLIEHKNTYHPYVWTQHYEFVGNQSELYRHLSIPGLGKVGVVEEKSRPSLWRRSEARLCTKCGRQCNALGDLHRHILECGGDWTWMLARKKCKYRPFGAKSRRKRRGLVKRIGVQKSERTEKKIYKKHFDGPRQRPSDADSIQRMLANLPAKRATRKVMSLKDGYQRNNQPHLAIGSQNKMKCGKLIIRNSNLMSKRQRSSSSQAGPNSQNQKGSFMNSRRSVRNLNKVLASRILDTNTNLLVKRKLKSLNNQRATRRSVTKENTDDAKIKTSTNAEKPLTRKTIKSPKSKEESSENIGNKKNAKPKSSVAVDDSSENDKKDVKVKNTTTKKQNSEETDESKMSVKKMLSKKMNIKNFFPVKKKKNLQSDEKTDEQETEPKEEESGKSKSETQVTPEKAKVNQEKKVKKKSALKAHEKDVTLPKEETPAEDKSKDDSRKGKKKDKLVKKSTAQTTFGSLVRNLSIRKRKLMKLEEKKTEDSVDTEETLTEPEKSPKKRKLTLKNVINKVKKRKIAKPVDPVDLTKTSETDPKNTSGHFLEEGNVEETPPVEKIVIPSTLEKSENTADISVLAPIVIKSTTTNQDPQVPETIFNLQSNNERNLQAKGQVNFDTKSLPQNTSDVAQPISVTTNLSNTVSPMVSPNLKGKIRKPAKRLNDCIAMLTSKLQQKEQVESSSIFNFTPQPINLSTSLPVMSNPYDTSWQLPKTDQEECVALDLSLKSSRRKDSDSFKDQTKIKPISKSFSYNSIDQVIQEVIENNSNNIQNTLQARDFAKEEVSKKWNSVDDIIQKVVDGYCSEEIDTPLIRNRSKCSGWSCIDDIIESVAKGEDVKTGQLVFADKSMGMKTDIRKIGAARRKTDFKSTDESLDLITSTPTTLDYQKIQFSKEINLANLLSEKSDAIIDNMKTDLFNKKIGKPRNRKPLKSSIVPILKAHAPPSENNCSKGDKDKKLLLETNLDNILSVTEVNQKDEQSNQKSTVPVNFPVEEKKNETNIDKLLPEENEPVQLENKVVVTNELEKVKMSDSEDEIPLSLLKKDSDNLITEALSTSSTKEPEANNQKSNSKSNYLDSIMATIEKVIEDSVMNMEKILENKNSTLAESISSEVNSSVQKSNLKDMNQNHSFASTESDSLPLIKEGVSATKTKKVKKNLDVSKKVNSSAKKQQKSEKLDVSETSPNTQNNLSPLNSDVEQILPKVQHSQGSSDIKESTEQVCDSATVDKLSDTVKGDKKAENTEVEIAKDYSIEPLSQEVENLPDMKTASEENALSVDVAPLLDQETVKSQEKSQEKLLDSEISVSESNVDLPEPIVPPKPVRKGTRKKKTKSQPTEVENDNVVSTDSEQTTAVSEQETRKRIRSRKLKVQSPKIDTSLDSSMSELESEEKQTRKCSRLRKVKESSDVESFVVPQTPVSPVGDNNVLSLQSFQETEKPDGSKEAMSDVKNISDLDLDTPENASNLPVLTGAEIHKSADIQADVSTGIPGISAETPMKSTKAEEPQVETQTTPLEGVLSEEITKAGRSKKVKSLVNTSPKSARTKHLRDKIQTQESDRSEESKVSSDSSTTRSDDQEKVEEKSLTDTSNVACESSSNNLETPVHVPEKLIAKNDENNVTLEDSLPKPATKPVTSRKSEEKPQETASSSDLNSTFEETTLEQNSSTPKRSKARKSKDETIDKKSNIDSSIPSSDSEQSVQKSIRQRRSKRPTQQTSNLNVDQSVLSKDEQTLLCNDSDEKSQDLSQKSSQNMNSEILRSEVESSILIVSSEQPLTTTQEDEQIQPPSGTSHPIEELVQKSSRLKRSKKQEDVEKVSLLQEEKVIDPLPETDEVEESAVVSKEDNIEESTVKTTRRKRSKKEIPEMEVNVPASSNNSEALIQEEQEQTSVKIPSQESSIQTTRSRKNRKQISDVESPDSTQSAAISKEVQGDTPEPIQEKSPQITKKLRNSKLQLSAIEKPKLDTSLEEPALAIKKGEVQSSANSIKLSQEQISENFESDVEKSKKQSSDIESLTPDISPGEIISVNPEDSQKQVDNSELLQKQVPQKNKKMKKANKPPASSDICSKEHAEVTVLPDISASSQEPVERTSRPRRSRKQVSYVEELAASDVIEKDSELPLNISVDEPANEESETSSSEITEKVAIEKPQLRNEASLSSQEQVVSKVETRRNSKKQKTVTEDSQLSGSSTQTEKAFVQMSVDTLESSKKQPPQVLETLEVANKVSKIEELDPSVNFAKSSQPCKEKEQSVDIRELVQEPVRQTSRSRRARKQISYAENSLMSVFDENQDKTILGVSEDESKFEEITQEMTGDCLPNKDDCVLEQEQGTQILRKSRTRKQVSHIDGSGSDQGLDIEAKENEDQPQLATDASIPLQEQPILKTGKCKKSKRPLSNVETSSSNVSLEPATDGDQIVMQIDSVEQLKNPSTSKLRKPKQSKKKVVSGIEAVNSSVSLEEFGDVTNKEGTKLPLDSSEPSSDQQSQKLQKSKKEVLEVQPVDMNLSLEVKINEEQTQLPIDSSELSGEKSTPKLRKSKKSKKQLSEIEASDLNVSLEESMPTMNESDNQFPDNSSLSLEKLPFEKPENSKKSKQQPASEEEHIKLSDISQYSKGQVEQKSKKLKSVKEQRSNLDNDSKELAPTEGEQNVQLPVDSPRDQPNEKLKKNRKSKKASYDDQGLCLDIGSKQTSTTSDDPVQVSTNTSESPQEETTQKAKKLKKVKKLISDVGESESVSTTENVEVHSPINAAGPLIEESVEKTSRSRRSRKQMSYVEDTSADHKNKSELTNEEVVNSDVSQTENKEENSVLDISDGNVDGKSMTPQKSKRNRKKNDASQCDVSVGNNEVLKEDLLSIDTKNSDVDSVESKVRGRRRISRVNQLSKDSEIVNDVKLVDDPKVFESICSSDLLDLENISIIAEVKEDSASEIDLLKSKRKRTTKKKETGVCSLPLEDGNQVLGKEVNEETQRKRKGIVDGDTNKIDGNNVADPQEKNKVDNNSINSSKAVENNSMSDKKIEKTQPIKGKIHLKPSTLKYELPPPLPIKTFSCEQSVSGFGLLNKSISDFKNMLPIPTIKPSIESQLESPISPGLAADAKEKHKLADDKSKKITKNLKIILKEPSSGKKKDKFVIVNKSFEEEVDKLAIEEDNTIAAVSSNIASVDKKEPVLPVIKLNLKHVLAEKTTAKRKKKSSIGSAYSDQEEVTQVTPVVEGNSVLNNIMSDFSEDDGKFSETSLSSTNEKATSKIEKKGIKRSKRSKVLSSSKLDEVTSQLDVEADLNAEEQQGKPENIIDEACEKADKIVNNSSMTLISDESMKEANLITGNNLSKQNIIDSSNESSSKKETIDVKNIKKSKKNQLTDKLLLTPQVILDEKAFHEGLSASRMLRKNPSFEDLPLLSSSESLDAPILVSTSTNKVNIKRKPRRSRSSSSLPDTSNIKANISNIEEITSPETEKPKSPKRKSRKPTKSTVLSEEIIYVSKQEATVSYSKAEEKLVPGLSSGRLEVSANKKASVFDEDFEILTEADHSISCVEKAGVVEESPEGIDPAINLSAHHDKNVKMTGKKVIKKSKGKIKRSGRKIQTKKTDEGDLGANEDVDLPLKMQGDGDNSFKCTDPDKLDQSEMCNLNATSLPMIQEPCNGDVTKTKEKIEPKYNETFDPVVQNDTYKCDSQNLDNSNSLEKDAIYNFSEEDELPIETKPRKDKVTHTKSKDTKSKKHIANESEKNSAATNSVLENEPDSLVEPLTSPKILLKINKEAVGSLESIIKNVKASSNSAKRDNLNSEIPEDTGRSQLLLDDTMKTRTRRNKQKQFTHSGSDITSSDNDSSSIDGFVEPRPKRRTKKIPPSFTSEISTDEASETDSCDVFAKPRARRKTRVIPTKKIPQEQDDTPVHQKSENIDAITVQPNLISEPLESQIVTSVDEISENDSNDLFVKPITRSKKQKKTLEIEFADDVDNGVKQVEVVIEEAKESNDAELSVPSTDDQGTSEPIFGRSQRKSKIAATKRLALQNFDIDSQDENEESEEQMETSIVKKLNLSPEADSKQPSAIIDDLPIEKDAFTPKVQKKSKSKATKSIAEHTNNNNIELENPIDEPKNTSSNISEFGKQFKCNQTLVIELEKAKFNEAEADSKGAKESADASPQVKRSQASQAKRISKKDTTERHKKDFIDTKTSECMSSPVDEYDVDSAPVEKLESSANETSESEAADSSTKSRTTRKSKSAHSKKLTKLDNDSGFLEDIKSPVKSKDEPEQSNEMNAENDTKTSTEESLELEFGTRKSQRKSKIEASKKLQEQSNDNFTEELSENSNSSHAETNTVTLEISDERVESKSSEEAGKNMALDQVIDASEEEKIFTKPKAIKKSKTSNKKSIKQNNSSHHQQLEIDLEKLNSDNFDKTETETSKSDATALDTKFDRVEKTLKQFEEDTPMNFQDTVTKQRKKSKGAAVKHLPSKADVSEEKEVDSVNIEHLTKCNKNVDTLSPENPENDSIDGVVKPKRKSRIAAEKRLYGNSDSAQGEEIDIDDIDVLSKSNKGVESTVVEELKDSITKSRRKSKITSEKQLHPRADTLEETSTDTNIIDDVANDESIVTSITEEPKDEFSNKSKRKSKISAEKRLHSNADLSTDVTGTDGSAIVKQSRHEFSHIPEVVVKSRRSKTPAEKRLHSTTDFSEDIGHVESIVKTYSNSDTSLADGSKEEFPGNDSTDITPKMSRKKSKTKKSSTDIVEPPQEYDNILEVPNIQPVVVDTTIANLDSEQIAADISIRPGRKSKIAAKEKLLQQSKEVDLPTDFESECDTQHLDESLGKQKKKVYAENIQLNSEPTVDIESQNTPIPIESSDSHPYRNALVKDISRKKIRKNKTKALEHILDKALSELSESDNNCDLLSGNASNAESFLPFEPEERWLEMEKAETISKSENNETDVRKQLTPTDDVADSSQEAAVATDKISLGTEGLEPSIEDTKSLDQEIEDIFSAKSYERPRRSKSKVKSQKDIDKAMIDEADIFIEEQNLREGQEIRRSRRNARKITTYNENEIEKALMEIDESLMENTGTKKREKSPKAGETVLPSVSLPDTQDSHLEDIPMVLEDIQHSPVIYENPSIPFNTQPPNSTLKTSEVKSKGNEKSEKKLNSDELFDLLKASSPQNTEFQKPQNASFLPTFDEISDFSSDSNNFDNVFEDILEIQENLDEPTKIDDDKENDPEVFKFSDNSVYKTPKSNEIIKNDKIEVDKVDDRATNLNENKSDSFLTSNIASEKSSYDGLNNSEDQSSKEKSQMSNNLSEDKTNFDLENTNSSFVSNDLTDTTKDKNKLQIKMKIKTSSFSKSQSSVASFDSADCYCEICKKSFSRPENLLKHKRTLTHISKLSELEAKEAQKKLASEERLEESSKSSDDIITITDSSKADITITSMLQSSESQNHQSTESQLVSSSFANNHSIKLADIINDVLNKPVMDKSNGSHNNFSDIILQSSTEVQPEFRRYKSLGERKSFDSESSENVPHKINTMEPSFFTPEISDNTKKVVEKQITLLQNIIEKSGATLNYMDEISVSSNQSELDSARESPSLSVTSSRQDDSNNLLFSNSNVTDTINKVNVSEDSFIKPSQYEEISEDSTNLRSYEDQKSRKVLNRDEELFLECCSLLKSGSEVSNYSKKSHKLSVINHRELKISEEPDLMENKNLGQKQLYEDNYSDNSRIPTPLGDNYNDEMSNSNTISSNWHNINNKDIQENDERSEIIEREGEENRSFVFHEDSLGEKHSESDGTSGKALEFANISRTIRRFSHDIKRRLKNRNKSEKGRLPETQEENVEVTYHTKANDFVPHDTKNFITKGAKKEFEGLRVSIPTEELNLAEVLQSSPISKNEKILFQDEHIEESRTEESKIDEIFAPPTPVKRLVKKPKSKVKVQKQKKFGFKAARNKLASKFMRKKKQTGLKNTKDSSKTVDVYDFEETQDNSDIFMKPDFKTFRCTKKVEEETTKPKEFNAESDNDSQASLGLEAKSGSSGSSLSSTPVKKPKTQPVTKKKCMIMGRIFKNAVKKAEEDIRDIPAIDNNELVNNYVLNCPEIPVLSKKTDHDPGDLLDSVPENKMHGAELKDAAGKIKCVNKKKNLKLLKNRKRARLNSDSTDDEFSINKTTKKRSYKKNPKAEDNCINLEQELKECIGVASRKSQRKCTSGKQNVLVEYWSSDDSSFEALLASQIIHTESEKPKVVEKQVVEPAESIVEELESVEPVEPVVAPPLVEPCAKPVEVKQAKPKKSKSTDKKITKKPKLDPEVKKSITLEQTAETLASSRRKRAAADPLYHWSSSSEDESQDLIEVKPLRDEVDDDEDRPIQHGWIVGDSPKKLVTMLAQAKGKKIDTDCVKEQGKKRTASSTS